MYRTKLAPNRMTPLDSSIRSESTSLNSRSWVRMLLEKCSRARPAGVRDSRGFR